MSVLYAHKAVLAARVPFFRSMFSSGCRESGSGTGSGSGSGSGTGSGCGSPGSSRLLRLCFPEHCRAAVLCFLDWAYTGGLREQAQRLMSSSAVAADALSLAEYLCCSGFKGVAEAALLSELSAASAISLLLQAHRCNADKLKSAALNFVLCNGKDIKDLSSLAEDPALLLLVTQASLIRGQ